MVGFTVTHNFRQEAQHLRSLQKQARFAAVGAINDTLFAVRAAEITLMQRSFDRPTPFTLKSPRVQLATRDTLAGEIYIPDQGTGKELPGGKPLLAEVYGGPRRFKRSEKLLQAKGVLPKGMYAVPGPAAEIDVYGNWSRRQILHILAYFQAYGDTARSGRRLRSNTTDAGRERLRGGRLTKQQRGFLGGPFGVEYFVIQPGQVKGLRAGIYQRQLSSRKVSVLNKRGVRAVLFFVTGATYKRLLAFHAQAERTAAERFQAAFDQRFARALATAR